MLTISRYYFFIWKGMLFFPVVSDFLHGNGQLLCPTMLHVTKSDLQISEKIVMGVRPVRVFKFLVHSDASASTPFIIPDHQ